jgi:aminoglycoside/choline kinase family phosphotransferase
MKSLFENLLVKTTGAERRSINRLVAAAGLNPAAARLAFLAGDGSDRRFLRIGAADRSLIAVLPNLVSKHGRAEARAAWFIGRHLQGCGVPVPALSGYDPATGVVVCEDLGDRLLYDEVLAKSWSATELVGFYEPAVALLAHMQIAAPAAFKSEWCWDTERYDRELMLTRESGYFMEACWRQLLGQTAVPAGLVAEFTKLADSAAALPAGFFLHRDFQSRNLMLQGGCLRVIDFQGGRLGPLGYDLASLLIDPYVALPGAVRDRLLRKYREVLAGYPGAAAAFSVEGYYLLAVQRNLQILGAFAFLTAVKGKPFFRGYLGPAALGLRELLNEPAGRRFPVLRAFAVELPDLLAKVLA